ncbi:4-hydroxyphenylpyruvate dioxygenase [Penicillium herquei]|nr:4-hydroxyphenylpyruvate dioxygenase [Penicillium herquei]
MPNRLGISSMSLGRAWAGHTMDEKLGQASSHGFSGVEIFFEDLEQIADALSEGTTTLEHQIEAANTIRGLCDRHNLTVICLQPFLFYEGLKDRNEHAQRIEKLQHWFELVKIFRTDLIQIPANFLPAEEITSDTEVIVQDMIEVADMGLKQSPTVRFVYENLAWGTYVDTWEAMWDIVKRVDRPNFGCCLDTFNIAGRIWANPASSEGTTPDADAVLEASMERLVKTVDIRKVFYVQVVDAERLSQPLIEGHEYHVPEQPARMSWSRNCRLFAMETDRGGYLPVVKIANVIFNRLGYSGWVSLELFSRTMADPSPTTPKMHAQRGSESWKRLKSALNLE